LNLGHLLGGILGGIGHLIGGAVHGVEHIFNPQQQAPPPQQQQPVDQGVGYHPTIEQQIQDYNQQQAAQQAQQQSQIQQQQQADQSKDRQNKIRDITSAINQATGGAPGAPTKPAQGSPNVQQKNPVAPLISLINGLSNVADKTGNFTNQHLVLPPIQNVGNVATDIQQGLPIVGDVAQNQKAADQQQAAIEKADTDAQLDYKSGKISKDRLVQLLYSNAIDRARANNQLQEQASQYRTPQQAANDLAQLGINIGSVGIGSAAASVPEAALKGAAINAGLSGASGAAQSYGQGGNVKDILKEGGVGALEGAGVGAVLGPAGHLAEGALHSPHLNNERGTIGPGDIENFQKRLDESASLPTKKSVAQARGATRRTALDQVPDEGIISRDNTPPQVKADTQAAIQAQQQNPLFNQLVIPAAAPEDLARAVLNTQAVQKGIADRLETVHDTAHPLSPHDISLLDELRTKDIKEVTMRADNPHQFLETAKAAKDLNDYTQEYGRLIGQKVNYRKNYGAATLYDTSHQPTGAALDDIMAQLAKNPGYGKARVLEDYKAGEALGLKRKNQNFIEDITEDAKRRSRDLGQLTFHKGLSEAFPEKVRVGDIGRDEQGLYQQVKIPGTKMDTPISLPKDIAARVNERSSYEYKPGKLGSALQKYDSLNAADKFFRLSLGGFHIAQEAAGFAAERLTRGDAKGLAKGIGVIFSKRLYSKEALRWQETGVKNKMNVSGLTMSSRDVKADVGYNHSPIIGRGRFNPIRMVHDSLWKREVPYMKGRIFETMTKDLDIKNPADVKEMQKIAKGLNAAFGGINRAVDGLTPKQLRLTSRGLLATDYNEGLTRSWVKAVSDKGVEGTIARRVVLGRRILLAAPGIAAYVVASYQQGQPLSPKDTAKLVFNQLIEPHIPSGFKTKSGIPKVIGLPKDVTGKAYTAAKSFFDGSPDPLSGIKSVASGNLSSLPGGLEQVLTNKDYYGNPIVTGNPGKTAINIASSFGPIGGGQLAKVLSGQLSPAEAAVNTLGGHVAADPNDPRMQALKEYYNVAKFATKAVGDDANAKTAIADYFSKYKTSDGRTKGEEPAERIKNAENLYGNDKARKAIAKAFQKTKSHDPMWDLPDDQLKTLMAFKAAGGSDDINGDEIKKRNPWIADFEKVQSAYYDKLVKSGRGEPSDFDKAHPYPKPDAKTQGLLDQYNGITDKAQRGAFIDAHPEVSDAFQKFSDYQAAKREAEGKPAYAQYPKASDEVKSALATWQALKAAGQHTSAFWNSGQGQQLSAYFNQTATFNASGPFGDGIGAGGGGKNLTGDQIAAKVEKSGSGGSSSKSFTRKSTVKFGKVYTAHIRLPKIKTKKIRFTAGKGRKVSLKKH
jgi:hypothetical protein